MQKLLQSTEEWLSLLRLFLLIGVVAFRGWEDPGPERGGSGCISLASGTPGGLPWPCTPEGKVMLLHLGMVQDR